MNFWTPALPPALSSAPPIIAAPIGPPTPVAMIAIPPTTIAPAAMYSQLSATKSAPRSHTLRPIDSRMSRSSASVTGRRPSGSASPTGLLAA